MTKIPGKCEIEETHGDCKKNYESQTKLKAHYKSLKKAANKEKMEKWIKWIDAGKEECWRTQNRKEILKGELSEKRVFLEPKDCLKNLQHLVQVFRTIEKIVSNNPVAEILSNPRVPSPLSEAIILHLLRNKKIILWDKAAKGIPFMRSSGWKFRKGAGNDITGKNKNIFTKIEVKATGKQDFISIGAEDKKADYLFWLSFRNAFKKGDFSKIHLISVIAPCDNPEIQKWTKDNMVLKDLKNIYEKGPLPSHLKIRKINLNKVLNK